MPSKKLPKTNFYLKDYVKYFRSVVVQGDTKIFDDMQKGYISGITYESDEKGNITFKYTITDKLGLKYGYLIPEAQVIKRLRRPKREEQKNEQEGTNKARIVC